MIRHRADLAFRLEEAAPAHAAGDIDRVLLRDRLHPRDGAADRAAARRWRGSGPRYARDPEKARALLPAAVVVRAGDVTDPRVAPAGWAG